MTSLGKAWWVGAGQLKPDQYAAFRGRFELAENATVTLKVIGAHWFKLWLDGEYLTEGPYRFPTGHAEYEMIEISLKAGRHVLAAMVRHEGIETRILQSQLIPPFLLTQLLIDGREIAIDWKALHLAGYPGTCVRMSPQFAWVEWADTRQNPADWHVPGFDDSAWTAPVEVESVRDWEFKPVDLARLKRTRVEPRIIDEGVLEGPFEHSDRPGWQTDDGFPWYQRDLAPKGEANGIWRRYDLGYVMLGAPEITIEAPAGAVVEIAYSEFLTNGRVTPFIPLSVGPSRNMDHFVARGGRQTMAPLVPKGGRFIEIHIGAASELAKIEDAVYWRRTYYGEPVGEFRCDDEMLNRVWQLGIETLRSCSEDAIIDNPTRERGQWTGDVLLSLYIAAGGYNDVRLFKRGLQHSAWCARPDGLVAGLSPGGPGYLATYSAQWVTAAVNYAALTGDHSVLEELLPAAKRNMEVILDAITPEGVRYFEWPFVDWGYPGSQGSSTEMGVNLHVLEAIRHMQAWCDLKGEDITRYQEAETRLREAIERWLQPRISAGEWEKIDFHCVTLALRNELVPEEARPAAIAYLKQHILSCYPNDLSAPLLANPDFKRNRLISPYFAYYYLEELARAGEIDFILEQFRICWGWSLKKGVTTQPEVFGLAWSHCHVWASSPTAQLTAWVLGLRAHFILGRNHYEFTFDPGSLARASGKIPLIDGEGAITISWERDGDQITYNVDTPEPIWIHLPDGNVAYVTGQQKLKLDLPVVS